MENNHFGFAITTIAATVIAGAAFLDYETGKTPARPAASPPASPPPAAEVANANPDAVPPVAALQQAPAVAESASKAQEPGPGDERPAKSAAVVTPPKPQARAAPAIPKAAPAAPLSEPSTMPAEPTKPGVKPDEPPVPEPKETAPVKPEDPPKPEPGKT